MKELDCQNLIIDAVRAQGGAATKLSNRFLVGVSDLLVKLPKYPAALFEVKLEQIGASTSDGHSFVPDLTKLQSDFLRDYCKAGMTTGLISCMERGRRGVKGLHMAAFTIDDKKAGCYRRGDALRVGAHVFLGDYTMRDETLIKILEDIYDGNC